MTEVSNPPEYAKTQLGMAADLIRRRGGGIHNQVIVIAGAVGDKE
jgi:hypothetical protein